MLKIILADNQAIFRAGAAKVLAVEDDIRVVAQAENTEKLFSALNSFKASVLIVAESLKTDVTSLVETARKNKTSVVMIGDAPYPKAAPNVWPYPGHGTLAEADAKAEALARAAERFERTRHHGCSQPGKPACPANEPVDYGSPYAVRRSA